ncbi:MAG TPA: ABC transporter substrate-binding protein [Solirubrobacteraceae bacterium]|jgi:ribose transport system substrate-binding protein|nr:ABC transporter substrate-binding protein [Solirubrobacteraceae bacterium]
MNMKKPAAALVTLLAAALALTACGSTSNTASGGSGTKKSGTLNIAFIPGITTDGFFIAMQHAAAKTAPGLKINLDYTGPTQYSYSAQTQVFNSVLAQHPDGIIFASTDAKAMEAPVRQAAAAGIPVMTVDSTVADQSLLKSNVATSDEVGGKLAADEMAKLVGTSGAVAVVGYIPGITTTDARTKAFLAEMKAKDPGVKLLGTQYSNASLTKAASIATGLVSSNPNLRGIFVVNDLNAAGVINGLKSINKIGAIKVVAYDAEPDEIGFLKSGAIQATIVQKPSEEASISLQRMAALLHNGTKPNPMKLQLNPIVATLANMNQPSVSQYFYR